jgi:TetR/AcrR family transcriptional regulator, regulator of cefoperazone and chloramphenicol sensitivity
MTRAPTAGNGLRSPAPRALRDAATRQRLLDVATLLFTERGLQHVTVRDICRDAGANVAAVNYHFGDKLGLYLEVVQGAIAAMRATTDLTMQPPEHSAPEEQLRHYVHTFVKRLAGADGRPAWIHKLMAHEMNEPTPATARIAEQAIRPRLRYLTTVVAALMARRTTDRRVQRCVASIQAQCVFYGRLFHAPDPFRTAAFPDWPSETAADITAIAEHITAFSLAGIRAANATTRPRTRRASSRVSSTRSPVSRAR